MVSTEIPRTAPSSTNALSKQPTTNPVQQERTLTSINWGAIGLIMSNVLNLF